MKDSRDIYTTSTQPSSFMCNPAESLPETLAENKRDHAEWVARVKAEEGRVIEKPATVATTLTCDDLQRRLDMLQKAGVRSYKDGALEIVFDRQLRWSSGKPVNAEEVINVLG